MSAFAGVLVLSAFTAWTPTHALQDPCAVAAVEGSAGTVESLREVALPRDLHGFDAEALARNVRPDTAEELVVRLDAGPLVVFTRREPHRLRAGQRVRVQLSGSVARVEREPGECATPLALSPNRNHSIVT
jgi:hypothetical protein